MPVNTSTTRLCQPVKLLAAWRDTPGISQQRRIATMGRFEAARAGHADVFVAGLPYAAGVPSLVENPREVTIVSVHSPSATCLLIAN